MCSQPKDYFLEPLWSLKKAVARLLSPEPRSANLNSAAANLRPSSALPTSRTPSPANRAVDPGSTVPSETPDNSAAHQVMIGYDQVKHHTRESEDRSRDGPRSPNIFFIVAKKSYIVTQKVYPPTYPSNPPIDRGLASADNDCHVLKHQSANISTTDAEISTTVPLDVKIFSAFSTVDDAEMAVAGMISLIFLLIKPTSILI